MKSFLLFISVLFGTNLLLAQPTLDNTNIPVPGNTSTFIYLQPNDTDPGPAGEDQTWDFSYLTIDESITNDIIEYVEPGNTPFAGEFTTATVCELVEETYSYYTIDGGDLFRLGSKTVIDNSTLTETYTDLHKVMEFPFNYGDSFTDVFEGTNQTFIEGFGFNTTKRWAEITLTADGWGTLILPAGIVNNVLRIKSEMLVTDTASIEVQGVSFSIITEVESETYIWMIPGEWSPIFNIDVSTTKISGIPGGGPPVTTVRSVRLLDKDHSNEVDIPKATLGKPLDGAEGVMIPVDFSWDAIIIPGERNKSGNVKFSEITYDIQISEDVNFNSTLKNENTDQTTYIADDLEWNTQYWWRVRGVSGETKGEWSDPRSFTTRSNGIPDVPVLMEPDSASTVPGPNVTVSWSEVEDADGYNLIYGTIVDGEFITDKIDYISDTSYELTDLEYRTTYQWSVAAYFDIGTSSSFSDFWMFTTEEDPVSVQEISTNSNQINIYPNPANDILKIQVNEIEQFVDLRIVDISGNTMINNFTRNGNNIIADISKLSHGSYFLQATVGQNTYTGKFQVK